MNCSQCHAELGARARFCSRCGKAVATADAITSSRATTELSLPARQDLTVIDDHLVWNLHPGQVARKLTPAAISALPRARGIAIHDGTRALVFANGRLVADLQSGVFEFDRPRSAQVSTPDRRGFFDFLSSRSLRVNDPSSVANTSTTIDREQRPSVEDDQSGRSPLLEVLLIRQGPLPLLVTLRDVRTASVTTTVALQFMLEIVDPAAFSRMLMQVRDELGLNALSVAVMGAIESALRKAFQQVPAEQIVPDPVLETRLASTLTEALGEDWGFLRVVRVAKVAAHRQELATLHEISDATYLSERALHQASVRSEFANRLREQRNRQRIDEAAGLQQVHAELQRINRDGLISQDDLIQFELMLEHGRRLRDAKTEDEYQRALGDLRKNELIREDSITALARKLTNDQQDRTRQRTHSLAVFDLSQQLEMDQARLQWEYDIGDKRIALELDRRLREHLSQYEMSTLQRQQQRQDDAYTDERQRLDSSYADQRRRAEHEHEHRERVSQLDLTRQAQVLTDRRHQDEHQRSQETAAQRARDERDLVVAEAQRWTGMTVEQIMAANPTLTSAAATALATKYAGESAAQAEKAKAEATAANNGHRAEAAEQTKNELREFMTNQLATMQELVRHTLEANAKIASAFAGGHQQKAGEVSTTRTVGTSSLAYCSRCGRRLESGSCPVCSPATAP